MGKRAGMGVAMVPIIQNLITKTTSKSNRMPTNQSSRIGFQQRRFEPNLIHGGN